MDGILLINKETGMTSHDVVNKLRKILHIKRIGHSGTLDPQASGVLLVMVGKACKVLPFLEDTDKEYIAKMVLGKKTISDDIWEEVLEEKQVTPISDFQSVLDTFKGEIKQLPPMISSIKVNGKKLYEYARANQEVERPVRTVTIYDIEALDEKELCFRVSCSSGTYVRSLCHDIAEKTNNFGCMSSLIRTKVGRFTLEDCVTIKDVEEGNYILHPVKEVLSHYKEIKISDTKDVVNGRKVHLNCEADEVLLTHQEEALAIYRREHGDVFGCIRGLW